MTINFKVNKDKLINFYCKNMLKTKGFKKVSFWFSIYILLLMIFVLLLSDEKGLRLNAIIGGSFFIIYLKNIYI